MKLRMYEKGNPLGRGLLPAGLPELTGNWKLAEKYLLYPAGSNEPARKTEQVFLVIRK